ncbi:MAG TPA: VWA domain-containing protein [Steroidobacteraceae bacterium]|nr:VWA domain-containing protein [Steroidobacteraceae bacterium]
MLVRFFSDLRAGGVPVTLPEYLSLLEGLEARVAALSPEDFYYFARMALVKDERHFDRFDRVFAEHFAGAEKLFEKLTAELPADWLKLLSERLFSEEEKLRVQCLGGWEKLLETLRQRLREQQGRHEGGNRWIGTAGTSPFGNRGFHPEGVRIGQAGPQQGRAVKVWEARDYRNLDDGVELGTRNLKMALRRLRRFAREGAPEELDLEGTIDSTARNAGILDIRLQPERRNAIKLLLLLDVGGSMDPHVQICEELFSAARAEFKHLEYFYFHNFPYERLWKDNRRRFSEITDTRSLMRKFHHDYHVVFIGDATMSPYEIEQPGGSVEHWNDEAGRVWMQRITAHFPRLVWLNPEPEDHWKWTPSVQITREIIGNRMFPLTLDGIDRAMRELKRKSSYTAPDVS